MRNNVSVPTDDFKVFAGEFPPFLYNVDSKRPLTGRLIMKNLIATWRSVYSTPMALFLSRWGWCYSFNIANDTDLIDFSKWEKTDICDVEICQFLFWRTSPTFAYNRKFDSTTWEALTENFPWKTTEADKGLKVELDKYHKLQDLTRFVFHKSQVFEGFHIIIHDPFELPTRDSSHYHTIANSTVVIWINVEASKVDESLHGFTPEKWVIKISLKSKSVWWLFTDATATCPVRKN